MHKGSECTTLNEAVLCELMANVEFKFLRSLHLDDLGTRCNDQSLRDRAEK